MTADSVAVLRKPPHPLKQPYRDIGPTHICRFHNYRFCDKGKDCDFDHTHCHICLHPGNIALECEHYLDDDLFRKFQRAYTLKNTRPVDLVKRTIFGHKVW
mmetsp:Transcript_2862/g.3840  ORF Transcript_2862/g.3840 Transcript_2862/m.3840 type:complete len:101 (-) Transcript_2862:121-423(-)